MTSSGSTSTASTCWSGLASTTRRRARWKILEQAGCPVDYDRTWASLPRDLVEWALSQAPRVVRLCARDPERDVVLDGRRSHHTCDSQGTEAIDLETGRAPRLNG